eukprot:356874-Chlamydomonas_euryale.AAC.2
MASQIWSMARGSLFGATAQVSRAQTGSGEGGRYAISCRGGVGWVGGGGGLTNFEREGGSVGVATSANKRVLPRGQS